MIAYLQSLLDASPVGRARARLLLSRAKHRSLAGHPRMAVRLSRLIPAVSYGEDVFFKADGAPPEIESSRRAAFERLSRHFREKAKRTLAMTAELRGGVSDLSFISAYRVPFQFSAVVNENLPLGAVIAETRGPQVSDLDGNWSYDLGGSYGVNVFGADFYKRCIDRGVLRARDVGLLLGSYHPVVAENVARLKEISGMDEVSFHMSGTEAVMQAVRLARYHTRRSHVVRFCGAYHGWWDGVQGGVGNPRPAPELYTLSEMSETTLEVLRTRDDIACVLVNPIQAMHPNSSPPSDSTLLASDRAARYDKLAYQRWLRDLREVCAERGIVLVFDEVFLGFRLAPGGVQEYFGVKADLVTYGKTLGGGLPVGVLCGRRDLMRRYREDRPADVCLARGTFNAHPYVMTTMNEVLRHLDTPEAKATYADLDARWNARAATLDERLERLGLPVRVVNMASIWTTIYTRPSRYNWMFQYYLRAAGISLSWIGTGRFIFSHDLTDEDFAEIVRRFVSAAEAMNADGWWWADAALSNRDIKRRVLRETVSAALSRGASGRSTRP